MKRLLTLSLFFVALLTGIMFSGCSNDGNPVAPIGNGAVMTSASTTMDPPASDLPMTTEEAMGPRLEFATATADPKPKPKPKRKPDPERVQVTWSYLHAMFR